MSKGCSSFGNYSTQLELHSQNYFYDLIAARVSSCPTPSEVLDLNLPRTVASDLALT
jgi:hypothetical protein